MSDDFTIPEFLRRPQPAKLYRPRAIRIKLEPMPAPEAERWADAETAIIKAYPPAFPQSFPCGRRRVWFIRHPRKKTVSVNDGQGAVVEIAARDFDRALTDSLA